MLMTLILIDVKSIDYIDAKTFARVRVIQQTKRLENLKHRLSRNLVKY